MLREPEKGAWAKPDSHRISWDEAKARVRSDFTDGLDAFVHAGHKACCARGFVWISRLLGGSDARIGFAWPAPLARRYGPAVAPWRSRWPRRAVPVAAVVNASASLCALRARADLRALGVTRLWLFGSVARGDPGRRRRRRGIESSPARVLAAGPRRGPARPLRPARARRRCRHSRRSAAGLGNDWGRSDRDILMARALARRPPRPHSRRFARIEAQTADKNCGATRRTG